MSGFAGKEGRIRLASIAYDVAGNPIDTGPSGGPDLAQVIGWRLWVEQELVEASVFGASFREYERGLSDWRAEVELLWDAANASAYQEALWACAVEDDFTSDLNGRERIELTFFVDGGTAHDKRAYYGAAALRDVRVVTVRDDVVRVRTRFVGVGPLHYRAGMFADGSFGAMEGYAFGALEAMTFGGIESIAEP